MLLLLVSMLFVLLNRRNIILSLATMSFTPKPNVRILLHGGDNMLGRGIQLTFPVQSPGEELIRDSCAAEGYLWMGLHNDKDIGELRSIRILNEQRGEYLWGHAPHLAHLQADLTLMNLETAVTRSIQDPYPGKGINYHMNSENFYNILGGLKDRVGGPLVVVFSNNHCLDFGRRAFEAETLPLFQSLTDISTVGCGFTSIEAARPFQLNPADSNAQRITVHAFSTQCSGTPLGWNATKTHSGILVLPYIYNDMDVDHAMDIIKGSIAQEQKSDTIRIISIHWGPNWAHRSEREGEIHARQRLAHRLIDEYNVDLIYGHSSHHTRGLELYHGKLILYGAGDIINDYEGFQNPGEELYNTLGGIFVVDLLPSGDLYQLRIIPTVMNQLRLERVTPETKIWRPNQRNYEINSNQYVEYCNFINHLSALDAGSAGTPLLLHHVISDDEIPGGPILKSQILR
jgi:poly-gamma-glutamate capsule biosynthesis protein CapA/YwtB (metallophosphatase superfamily)